MELQKILELSQQECCCSCYCLLTSLLPTGKGSVWLLLGDVPFLAFSLKKMVTFWSPKTVAVILSQKDGSKKNNKIREKKCFEVKKDNN